MSVTRYFLAAIAVVSTTAVFSSVSQAQIPTTLPPAAPPPPGGTSTPAAPPSLPAPPIVAPDIGQLAPDFTLSSADSLGPRATPVTLSSLKGKVVVIAFYPGDRTSGCTAELTKFRDEYATMFGKKTVVIGISSDGVASHASWATEMKFPFMLASDTYLLTADKYGSHTPGRTSASRTVFVIDKTGRIFWRNLKFGALNEGAYTELAAQVAKAQLATTATGVRLQE